MTGSTHTYTVEVLGTPDVALSFRGGQATLDASRAPHVQADVEVALPDAATLALLDPRLNARVRLTADAAFPSGVQHREFDLCLRRRPVAHRPGEVQLALASDEALLMDYRPLADDDTPYQHQDSLRGLVDYVLDTAIPGAALEATPDHDADAHVYSDSINECANPCAQSALTGWSAVGTSNFTRQTGESWVQNSAGTAFRLYGSSGSGVTYIRRDLDVAKLAGQRWLFRARQRNASAIGSGTPDPGPRIVVVIGSESLGNYAVDGTVGPTTSSTTADHELYVDFPADTTGAHIRLYHGVRSSDSVLWSDIRYGAASDDPTDVGFFDGSTPDTAVYEYAWTGTAGSSTSTRKALLDRPADALRWQAGMTALDFLAPRVQAAGLRLVCDEQRRWTLRGADYLAPGSLNVRYGINLVDATDTLSREDASTFFDAAVTVYEWTDRHGTRQRRVDAFALNDPYTRCELFERNTPYPGPGFSEYAVRRAQGRGRVVDVTKVADWRAHAEQPCAFYVPAADPQTGKTDRVVFDFDTDEVNATARTTDTPEGAWLLGDTDEEWLDTPDGNWLEE